MADDDTAPDDYRYQPPHLDCDSCGCKSGPLSQYPGLRLYGCRDCKVVFQVERTPFRFNPSQCPGCKKTFERSERISQNHLGHGATVTCPACKNKTLRYSSSGTDILFRIPDTKVLPLPGDTIHGIWMEGAPCLYVPGLWGAKTALEGQSWQSLSEGYYKFAVVAIRDQALILRMLGPLPPEELWD